MQNSNINAYCSICGNGYHLCNSCSDSTTIKPWRSVVDTLEHYKIYLAIHGYTISKNKEKVKKELSSCDLTNVETFNPEIKKVIAEILREENNKTIVNKKKNIQSNDSNMDNIEQEGI